MTYHHVVTPGFGREVLRNNAVLENVLQTTEPLTADAAQILMEMTYDVAFGLFDHTDPTTANPLSPAMLHPGEQYYKEGPIYQAILRYERQDIRERFGLSLTEYLDLPDEYITMLTDVTIELAQRDQNLAENAEKQNHVLGPRSPWKPTVK